MKFPVKGLQAFWKLEEPAGADRLDVLGISNLIDVGVVPTSPIPGKIDNAAGFTGVTGNRLTVPHNGKLNDGNSFSLAFWGMVNDVSNIQMFLSKVVTWAVMYNGIEYAVYYYPVVSAFRFSVCADLQGSAADATTFGIPNVGEWNFIYCYWEKGIGAGISVNNGPVDKVAFTHGCNPKRVVTADFQVGRAGTTYDNYQLNGGVDAVGKYDHVLTAAEISKLWNNGKGRQP